ncbi:MAG: flagellar hook-basal body complex protein [Flavonifractor plautii]
MTKGFYNLTSGILSQSRRLDTVANNMTNLSTSGYKAEQYTDSTFQEVLISRVGNKDKSSPTVIGEESYILAPSQLYVDYSQGSLEETGLTLDFAIEGDGFFAIQTAQGVEYTRSGSFSLDGEGYSCRPPMGGFWGGWTTNLSGHRPYPGRSGREPYTEGGGYVGRLGLYAFADNGQLEKMRAACSVRMGRRRLPPRRSSTGNGWRMPTWTCSRR